MIFTTSAPQLPGSRLSPPALLAVSLVHIALFWLLLQTAPVQRVVRETVVMLNLPITQPLPKPPPKKIITVPKPPEVVKPVEKPVVVKKTITTPVEPLPVPPKPPEPPKPVEKPVEKLVVVQKPPEKVVEVKPVEVVIPKEVPKEIPKEVVNEVPKELPKEIAKPVVAELPPAPSPAPAPVIPTAVVAAPAPTAAPAAEPAKASVAAVASAAAAPLAAPAVTPSAGKSNTSITTSSATPSSGATAASVAAPAGSGAPSLGGAIVNPLGTGLGGVVQPSGIPYPGGPRGGWLAGELQKRSSAQLNPNKRQENFETEMHKAGKTDCLRPAKDAAGEANRGLLALPQLLNRVTSGDCP